MLSQAETALTTEREKAQKSAQALKAATTLVSQKDGEVETARATLATAEAKAMVDIAVAQTEARKAVEAEIAVAPTKAEKATEEDFGSGFFQGYDNLKRRVALAHPEWDLSSLSGIDLDY